MNTKEYISSGIIESYILGLASPEEAGILECVMKNNAEVKAAFEEAQKTMEDLATAQAVTPPDDLKDKILNKIRNEQAVTSPSPIASADHPVTNNDQHIKIQKNSNWRTYAIAASLLFLISIAGNLFMMNNESKNKTAIAQLNTQKQSQDLAIQKMNEKLTMISDPNMQTVILNGVEKHPDSKAMVFWNKKTKEVYLNADHLPQAPEGMQYQLWAIADGKPVSAGMYTNEKDSKIALSNIPNAQAFAITLEKKGGSPTPTMENMFVMGNI